MRSGIGEMFFTSVSMIAAVTSILAGVGAALLLHAGGVPLVAVVTAGVGDRAGAVGDRRLPEPPFTMILAASRMLVAAGMAAGGQEVMDPGLVHIHAAAPPGDIGLGDHADWPLARLDTEHHQGGRPGVFHQVGGRSDVVVFPDRRR